MKLLMYVPIFGKLYPVFHSKLPDEHCGEFVGDKILINKKIHPLYQKELFKETLLHEMGHAFCYRCGLNQMPSFTMDIEEIVVEGFAKLFNEAFIFYPKNKFMGGDSK